MAHTRPMSVKHGALTLTLVCSGLLPYVAGAQEDDREATASDAAPIVVDIATPTEPEAESAGADNASIVIDMAAPLNAQSEPQSIEEPSAIGVYRGYIESMETSAGAFAPGLTEQLLGLGLNLQSLERHVEAAKVLKRGVHISRVQSGLYAADQIPLLRAEIRSLAALGFYDDVNERQAYLARVEAEALNGTPASIAALLDQGAWAEQAWELRLGEAETHPEHLVRSWEYYRLAYNQSTQLYGERAQVLLAPLEGMLRLQYRFANLQKASGSNDAFRVDSFRQSSALGGIYRRGEAVLSAIYGLKSLHGSDAGEQASDLTRLGDWAWWMGRRADAQIYYDRAWRRVTPPPPDMADPNLADASGENKASNDLTDQGAGSEPYESETSAHDASAHNPAGAEASVLDESAGASATTTAITTAPAPIMPTVATQLDAAPEAPAPEATASEAAHTDADTQSDRPAERHSKTESDGEHALALTAQPTSDSEEEATPAPPKEPVPQDNPVVRAALFQTMTPLPDIDNLRPLPPFSRDNSGPIVVQLKIDALGKITFLEQVLVDEVLATDESNDTAMADNAGADDNPADIAPEAQQNEAEVGRLLRTIRRTRFRPRYEAEGPVETDILTWSFDLNATNRDE